MQSLGAAGLESRPTLVELHLGDWVITLDDRKLT